MFFGVENDRLRYKCEYFEISKNLNVNKKMKNIFVTRIILVGVVLFFLAGFLIVQRQNNATNIAAAEQLDKADTFEKIVTFLKSQNEKITTERTKLVTEANKLKDAKDQNIQMNKLFKAYFQFESGIIEENIKAGEKILTIAKSTEERTVGYQCLIENLFLQNHRVLITLRDKRIAEAGIKETDADFESKATEIQEKLIIEDIVTEPQKRLNVIVEQMIKEGKFDQLVREYREAKLFQSIRILTIKFSLDKFNTKNNDVKT
ncbi:MAG: hypothetical protein LBH59_05435 [Planctomycetaceae bacterium]|jgi:cell division protein FtsB|nr:hypothetical protein [Planctomycetaceae bacterium]